MWVGWVSGQALPQGVNLSYAVQEINVGEYQPPSHYSPTTTTTKERKKEELVKDNIFALTDNLHWAK